MTTTSRSGPEGNQINPRWNSQDAYGVAKSYYGEGKYPPDWDARRSTVYRRDDYTCQECGVKSGPHADKDGVPLHAHHKQPLSEGGSNELRNLETVCEPCHEAEHGFKIGSTSRPSSPDWSGGGGEFGPVGKLLSIAVVGALWVVFCIGFIIMPASMLVNTPALVTDQPLGAALGFALLAATVVYAIFRLPSVVLMGYGEVTAFFTLAPMFAEQNPQPVGPPTIEEMVVAILFILPLVVVLSRYLWVTVSVTQLRRSLSPNEESDGEGYIRTHVKWIARQLAKPVALTVGLAVAYAAVTTPDLAVRVLLMESARAGGVLLGILLFCALVLHLESQDWATDE